MKTTFSLLTAAAVLAIAAPAQAQEAADVGPVSVRAELNFGYDELRARYTGFNFNSEDRFGVSALTTGAEVGVDGHFANLTAGAYAGLDLSQIDGCEEDIFFGTDSFCFDTGRGLKAGLRGGLRLEDGGQIYVKGGLSRLKASGRYTSVVNGADVVRFDQSETLKGYHIGGGGEVNLGRAAYIKGEYIYESFNAAFDLPIGDRVKPTRQQILFGVGFRFGGFGN